MKWRDTAKEHLVRELDKLLQVEAKLDRYNKIRRSDGLIVTGDPVVKAEHLITKRIAELSCKLVELFEGKTSIEEVLKIRERARSDQYRLDLQFVCDELGIPKAQATDMESAVNFLMERTATPTKVWAMGPGQHSPPEGLMLVVGDAANDEECKLTEKMDGLYWVKELEVKGAKTKKKQNESTKLSNSEIEGYKGDGMFKQYHEDLNLICEELGIPGAQTIRSAVEFIKERMK